MMASVSNVAVLRSVYRRMSGRLRAMFAWALFWALVVSVAQLAVVAAVALLGAALSSPEVVVNSSKIAILWSFLPRAEYGEPRVFIGLVTVCAALAVVVNNVLKVVSTYWAVKVSKEIEKKFSCSLMSGLLRMPYGWHVEKNSADVIAVTQWTTYYGAVASNIVIMACDVLSIVVVGVAVFFVDPFIGLGCMVIILAFGQGMAALTRKWLTRIAQQVMRLKIDKVRILHTGYIGIRDIRLFGREKAIADTYAGYQEENIHINTRQEIVKVLPSCILESVGFVAICGVVLYLLLANASTTVMAGTMALIAAAGWRLLPCVGKILGSLNVFRVSMPHLQAVEEYFADIEQAVGLDDASDESVVAPPFNKDMCLENVSFSYATASVPALTNLDLRVPRGGCVGIVGCSGSGKSTLMDVLCGLYLAQEGRVTVDDLSLDAAEVKAWQRRDVGYVSQSPYIRNGSLAENVAFGLVGSDIDRDKVLSCCSMAAIDFLGDLSDGIDTEIGDDGVRLSGGQRQRVAIARALYKDPEVLIFDEATSSLDTRSELAIQKTILGLRGNKTLIIVAHRLSTVEACDKVYWLEKGRLRMAGEADEVLSVYREYMHDNVNPETEFAS